MPVWRWILAKAIHGLNVPVLALGKWLNRMENKALGPRPCPLFDRTETPEMKRRHLDGQ